jgi:hypothetical protein
MNEELFKYIIKVLIFVLLIFALIIFVNSLGLNLNETPIPKKLIQSVTIEGLTNYEGLTNIPDTSIIQNKNDAFCESHRGSSHILNESCGNLTKQNCNNTSCCVWSSDQKCLAGSIDGPTFNTDSNGKTKKWDYYYFQDKCFGEKCT